MVARTDPTLPSAPAAFSAKRRTVSIVQQVRERLHEADSIASVQDALEGSFGALGFTQLSYVALRPPHGLARPKILSTYPKDWIDRYVDQNYANADAVFPAASAHLFPLRWDELYSDGHTTRKQRHVFDEAGDFGLKNGFTVPIHGPSGGLAALSLSGTLPRKEFEQIWRHYYDDLTLVAVHTHHAMLRNSDSDESYEPIHLTDREQECLLWTSRGKTSWEIGQILKISENTILFHLNRCMRKLRVFSKHHAVVKAIMLGIIIPDV